MQNEVMELEEADFWNLCKYIHENYGIDLHKKKQLITSRLYSMVQQTGYADFHSFITDIVSGRRPDLISDVLNRLTTNYTYFMRETAHFDFMKKTVLPQLEVTHRQDRSLAIWSAGCSSGEEPYSISIILKEYFGTRAGSWDTRILATDISMEVLSKAMQPSYEESSIRTLPPAWKDRYFVRQKDGNYTVTKALRDNVIFHPFNLMNEIPFRRKFDLIFCRNVMIYFDQKTKDALVQRFYDATAPGGYLFIGHSEGLNKSTCPYQYCQPAVFRKV